MSTRVYYRLSLALPFVLPAVTSAVVYLLDVGNAPGVLALVWIVWIVLLSSLIYGGVPYAILAAGLLWWSRGKNEERLLGSLYLAPVVMLPLLWLYQIIQGAILMIRGATVETYGQSAGEYLVAPLGGSLLYLSGCVIGLGYAYVALAIAGLALLKRLGWIRGQISSSA
jgi:hypothetical protein